MVACAVKLQNFAQFQLHITFKKMARESKDTKSYGRIC